jgi:predicted nucleic acid-binding protein
LSKKTSQVLVAIDSQTLAWCVIRENVTQPTPDEKQRAEWLLDELEEINARILIPAIVVSEYLIPIPKNRHAAIVAAISKRFIIAPFDAHCASLAAELFAVGKPQRPPNVPMGRECLRSDTLIIATAKVHSAKLFYTDDNACRVLAKTVLDARPLPINSKNLFQTTKVKQHKKPR